MSRLIIQVLSLVAIIATVLSISTDVDHPLHIKTFKGKVIEFPNLFPDAGSQNFTFGKNMLQYFAFDPAFTSFNFGSFGSTPRPVTKAAIYWEEQMERNCDEWFKFNLQPLYNVVVSYLSEFISANASNVVLIENASNAVNAVLRSQTQFQPKDKILYLNTIYNMVLGTLHYMRDTHDYELVEVNITFPTSSDEIIDLVKTAIQDNTGTPIRMACFSHITSTPAIIIPVKELIQLCRANNIITLIDGAHAMGQIAVNVTDLDPDYYLSNGHKWLYSPKGSAFLYVREEFQSITLPTVIDGMYGNPALTFQDEFFYYGTKSYSAMLAMSAAIDFRKAIGGEEKILNYIHNMAVFAQNTLSQMWNTSVLTDDSLIGAMANVRLPTNDGGKAWTMRSLLLENYDTYIILVAVQGEIYARVCCQIFTEESDVVWLGNAVLEILSAL